MSRRFLAVCCLTGVASLSVAIDAGAQPAYELVPLIPPDTSRSEATDVNDAGQVVGWSERSGILCAYIYDGTTIADLGALSGGRTQAFAINNAGQVAGLSIVSGRNHAFLWQNGVFVDLGQSTSYSTEAYGLSEHGAVAGLGPYGACWWSEDTVIHYLDGRCGYGINDAGAVVGQLSRSSGTPCAGEGFRYTGGEPTPLAPLGGAFSIARAINNAGHVAGWSSNAEGNFHATLWVGDAPFDLGTLGGALSEAYALNDAGAVVGMSHDASEEQHAFLWHNGQMFDLNDTIPPDSGWLLVCAQGINEQGWIAGWGITAGQKHGFLLKPAAASPLAGDD